MDIYNLTPAFILSIQALLAWALWSIRRAFVRDEEYLAHVAKEQNIFNELSMRLLTVETRLQSLEERFEQAPDAAALGEFAKAMEALRGDIKTLDMRITGLDRLMQRLENALDRQITGAPFSSTHKLNQIS